jgi:hypothetical protein
VNNRYAGFVHQGTNLTRAESAAIQKFIKDCETLAQVTDARRVRVLAQIDSEKTSMDVAVIAGRK